MKRPVVALTLLCVVAALPLPTHAAAPQGDGPWVLQIRGWTEENLDRLRQVFDHFAVFEDEGYLLLQADDRQQLSVLEQAELLIAVDERQTSTLRQVQGAFAAGMSLETIPGFFCYRTVEEMLAVGAALAAERPDLATWTDLGDSWEKANGGPGPGYDIMRLRLTNSAVAVDKPAFFVTGSTHAREYTTAELVTRFAEMLVRGHGVDPDITWILDHHEIHLVLVLNPDGRKQAETGLLWRKNANNNFCGGTNDRGIDLNRNYDFEWACCGGSSGAACSTTFRGPSAGSEPETQVSQTIMDTIFPDQRPDDLVTPAPDDAEGIYLDIHSFGSVVLSPWSFQAGGGSPPNGTQLLTLARKYAFFPDYTARLGSTGIVDGSSKDYAYGRRGSPGYTIELGTAFFESCSVFEADISPNNLPALLHTAKNVRTPYVTPSGPDTYDAQAPVLPVVAGQLAALTARVDDTRFVGGEPTQSIASAEVYVDTPPWDGGTPVAMAASDGAFNSTVEDVEVMLDTTGLAQGRHQLFFRGEDATSTFGAVSGQFLYVVEAGVSPTLQGTVTDAVTFAPLAATIHIGPIPATSTGGTGAYSQQVPSDTYEVTAVAPGYAPRTVEGFTLADTQTRTLNFELEALETLFDDDGEGGNLGWTAQGSWALTTETAFSPTHSWTDSPGGNYGNNADSALTSPVFDLGARRGTRLSFRHIYDFETEFDAGVVEISSDGGATWSIVRVFSEANQTASWIAEEIDLPQLDDAESARIRFRLLSDGGTVRDGWHLDDILLQAGPSAEVFEDGFETGNTNAWSATVP